MLNRVSAFYVKKRISNLKFEISDRSSLRSTCICVGEPTILITLNLRIKLCTTLIRQHRT